MIVVPGHTLALAQGQQKLYEFQKPPQSGGRGCQICHSSGYLVTCRARWTCCWLKAGVPYDLIFQLEDINDDFKDADITALVICYLAQSGGSYGQIVPDLRNATSMKTRPQKVYVVKRGEGKWYRSMRCSMLTTATLHPATRRRCWSRWIKVLRGLGLAAAA